MLDKYILAALFLMASIVFPCALISEEPLAKVSAKWKEISKADEALEETKIWWTCKTFTPPDDNGKWSVIVARNDDKTIVIKHLVNIGDSFEGTGKVSGGCNLKLKDLPAGQYIIYTTNGEFTSTLIPLKIND